MRKYHYAIFALLLLVIGLGVWYFLLLRENREFKEKLARAQELHHQEDVGRAIALFEELISKAPNKTEEAKIKLKLASDYTKVTYPKGVEIFKEIVANEEYPPYQRGLAIQYMGDLYMLGGRSAAVADVVFEGEPYRSFFNVLSPSPALDGIKELYEYGLTFTQEPILAINYYRIAEWHAYKLLNESQQYGGEKGREMYQKVREYFDLGEKALPNFLATNLEESQEIYVNWLRAHVLGYLAGFEKSEELKARADKLFQETFFRGRAALEGHVRRQTFWVALYDAIFLDTQYGTARTKDIREALAYLIQEEFSDTPLMNFIRKVATPTSEYRVLREQLIALSRYDEKFQTFLKEKGWKL